MHLSPDFSICTVTPAGDDKVLELLSSAQDTADPVSVEMVVVVNSVSPQFTERLDRRFPSAKILENLGAARHIQARNQALRLATGRYLSLWDRDVTLRPQCLLQLALFLDEHPETGIVVPCIENAEGKVYSSTRTFPTLFSTLTRYCGLSAMFPRSSLLNREISEPPFKSGPTEIDWAVGSAMVIRREVLEEIGYFNERYLAAYDEADFCRRAKRAGWHIAFLPHARICHDNPARYDASRILYIDPLSPPGSPRTHPEQLLDAGRFLRDALRISARG